MLLCFAAGWNIQKENADEVLIVLSSKSSPFTIAAESCTKQLKNAGINTKTILLSDLSKEQIRGISGKVITIGGRASKTMSQELPPSTQLYYCMSPSPEAIGLSSRNNTSGISSDSNLNEQINMIQMASSSIKKIGVLYRSSSTNSNLRIETVKDTIPVDMKIIAVDLDSHGSVSSAIKKLLSLDVDIVWTMPDPAVYNSAMVKTLLLECIRKRVPVFGFSHSIVKAGSTLGVGIDPAQQGDRVSEMLISESSNTHISPQLILALNEIVAERIKFKFNSETLQKAELVFNAD